MQSDTLHDLPSNRKLKRCHQKESSQNFRRTWMQT